MKTASRIEITPDHLPWWRRLFGLGSPRAEVEGNLHQAVEVANQNADLAEGLIEDLAQEKTRRNVTWPRPDRRLKPEQVRTALAVQLDEPLLAAVLQELDDQIQDGLDLISQAPSEILTEDKRLHLAGGLEHLRIFQKSLLDLHRDAQAEPDEEEKDD